MSALLDDPMVQAGVAPFVVALVVAWGLASVRLSWLALVAGVATTIALTIGISFTPLTAARKVVLLVLAAPVVGVVLDRLDSAAPAAAAARWLPLALAVLAGLATPWVFHSVLAQREGAAAWALGGGVALFVALAVGLTLRLRADGIAAGAATLGLGLAVGVAAILSASLGNMMNGVALAAGGGAMLLVQLVRGRAIAAGWTGTLSAGVAAALFAAATFVLAELPWHALALLLAVPAVAALPLFQRQAVRTRIVLLGLTSVLVASATILAAWLATRST